MTTSPIKKYPAESADIKHLISGQRKRNDHYLHSVIQFDRPINVTLLKRAVEVSFKSVPLLTCRFVETESRAYWEEAGWTADDMVHLIETTHRERALQKNLVIKLDETKGPQLRIAVIRSNHADTLAIVLNHMICDGGGIRDYLYLLSSCYTKLNEKPDDELNEIPGPGSRSIHQVFDNMNEEQIQQIKNARLHGYKQTEKDHLPLEGNESNPFIITHKVTAEQFDKIRKTAKQYGATINDALFAAYVCALSDELDTDLIVLDCPVNLRACLPDGHQPGICNLTSNIICAVPSHTGVTFDQAIQSVKKVLDEQKNSLEPLKVYWELEEIYQTLPLNEAKQRFPKVYNIPLNGMTNIGILDENQLRFADLHIKDVYISGSVKYVPYFQIAVTTFRKAMTFSTNFHGTEKDYHWLDQFVNKMISYFPK
ncbi:hypothetical protein EWI07_04840 [Sporolactobacillus sp. THM7-4]|nr:hypothetical protein EWI07_04840 [Sporolactobacillus sp. THM7-4]